MPTYSYACKKCEHEFDVQQSLNEPDLEKCPKCQGELRKVFGTVGITFKGTGFYRNDSGSAPKSD